MNITDVCVSNICCYDCMCMCVYVFATFVHKHNENNKKSFKICIIYRKMWAFYSEPYVLWIYWLKAHAHIQMSIAIEQIPWKKAFFYLSFVCISFHFYCVFAFYFFFIFKWKKTAQRNDYSVAHLNVFSCVLLFIFNLLFCYLLFFLYTLSHLLLFRLFTLDYLSRA